MGKLAEVFDEAIHHFVGQGVLLIQKRLHVQCSGTLHNRGRSEINRQRQIDRETDKEEVGIYLVWHLCQLEQRYAGVQHRNGTLLQHAAHNDCLTHR